MSRRRMATVATGCVAAALVSGCARTSDGIPLAESASTDSTTSSTASATSSARPAPTTTMEFDPPEFGVVPTTKVPVAAGTVTCVPPPGSAPAVEARVADPQAPVVAIVVPDGWSFTSGTGDIAMNLTGPEGMTATVTIARTELDPAAAFDEYTDQLMADAAASSVSVLPGELCAYSGQELMGTRSDAPGNAVEFRDRVAHVWTNTATYLVSVHVEAPTGVAAFDVAADRLTGDFAVTIP